MSKMKLEIDKNEQKWVQINEGRFIDGAILLVLANRLLRPFNTWSAYKAGIIDKDGNKIKDPSTTAEKDSWSLLNRLLAKIKKMFIKHKLLGSLLSFYVLLKEDTETQNDSKELILENLNRVQRVKDLNFRIKNEILKEGFTEDEYYTLLANVKIKEQIENGK